MGLRHVDRTTASIALLAFATACHDTTIDEAAAREHGRRTAEAEFRAGTATPQIGCGTIAPGPCSSVAEELYQRAFNAGYNRRLDELRRAAGEGR